MSLSNPKVPYKTIRDAILTLLRANKTALNVDMTEGATFSTTHNEQIVAGNPITMPIPEGVLPMIMVKIVRRSEKWEYLGAAGNKRPTITFRVYGIVSRAELSARPDDEIMNLASNIEGIFRDNISLDNASVIDSNPALTDFLFMEGEEGSFLDIVSIDLEVTVNIE